MRSLGYRYVVVLSLVVGLSLAGVKSSGAQSRWFRGNTHTHTNKAAPDVAARWYREHHYHFLVLTDVNRRTPVAGLNSILAAPGRFLVLDGIELSQEKGGKLIDVNGMGLTGEIRQPSGSSVVEMLNSAAKAVRYGTASPTLPWPPGRPPRRGRRLPARRRR